MSILLGITFIAFGAFSAGSFAVPFGKIEKWKWETLWMIYSLGAYIIVSFISCSIFSPGFIGVLKSTDTSVLLSVFLLGMVYGIGNLSFGLALRYLGLSLGYALALGLMLGIGTLIPPLLDGRLWEITGTKSGDLLFSGVIIAFVGIALSAWAGILKDKTLTKKENESGSNDFQLAKGIMAALLVGVTGSAMALGIDQGTPIATVAEASGVNPLFSMLPIMLVLLSGTFVTTLFWAIFLGVKNKSLKEYIHAGSAKILSKNYLFALMGGFLWFSQYILYSMGNSKMGSLKYTSWGILMALTIAFASVWGLIRKEWKGVSVKTYSLLFLSIVIIIVASFLIGMSSFN